MAAEMIANPLWKKDRIYMITVKFPFLQYFSYDPTPLLERAARWIKEDGGFSQPVYGVALGFGQRPQEMYWIAKKIGLAGVLGVDWITKLVEDGADYLHHMQLKPHRFAVLHAQMAELPNRIKTESVQFFYSVGLLIETLDDVLPIVIPGGWVVLRSSTDGPTFHSLVRSLASEGRVFWAERGELIFQKNFRTNDPRVGLSA